MRLTSLQVEHTASSDCHHDVVRPHRSFFGFLRTVFVHTRVVLFVSDIRLSLVCPCLLPSLVLGPLPSGAVGTPSLLPEFLTPPHAFSEIPVPLLAVAEILVPEI